MFLNLLPDIGSIRLTRLLAAFGSVRDVYEASEAALRQVEGISPVLAARIAAQRRDPKPVEEELRLAHQAGCAVVTLLDEGYPAPLKQISDPPLVLYMKGAWTEADDTAVAMVGSRHASLYGQQTAERLAYELALHGLTVVSGLARGIDSAAHRGALKAGGRTLAILGNGLSTIYPPEHRDLAEQIAAHGAVISEYPMRMQPLGQNFPPRNRLISGLSLGVVVVEAAQRSGALITADQALEQGREVFAVPGKVDSLTSQGTHHLLKQGAKLVTSVEDILEELRLEPVPTPIERVSPPATASAARTPLPAGMTTEERRIFEQLRADEPHDVDELVAATGLPASACAATLLGLEVKRLVKQLPGKRFVVQR